MNGPDGDPVDSVIIAFLDHREGIGERPSLDGLTDADRGRAEALLSGLTAARGIAPAIPRPSIESLLADTPLARLFPAGNADLAAIARALADVDPRAQVQLDAASATVVYSYLDLRARFMLVPTAVPVLTAELRTTVRELFATDPDTSRVGVVAGRGEGLLTQVLAADDLGRTITAPGGEAPARLDPPLPLALAAARILEQAAPQWPLFDFDQGYGGPLDLPTIATEIARQVIERESARAYRGDKRRAYQALVGQEAAFADLVVRVSAQGADVDVELETARILRAAA